MFGALFAMTLLLTSPAGRNARYQAATRPWGASTPGPVAFIGDRAAVFRVTLQTSAPLGPGLDTPGLWAIVSAVPVDGRGPIALVDPRLDVHSGRMHWSTALPIRGHLLVLPIPFYTDSQFGGPALPAGTRPELVVSFRFQQRMYAVSIRDVVVEPRR